MSKYQWLLFLHVTGAFFLAGGVIVAIALSVAARRRERPSEIALLLGLVRIVIPVIGIGAAFTLVFGLWLVHAAQRGYGYGQTWVILAVVFWVIGNALGGAGGKHEKAAGTRARELADAGDAPSSELRELLNSPRSLFLNYGGAAAIVIVLVLMVWKPGA
jgi:uncharacterized membrane protein